MNKTLSTTTLIILLLCSCTNESAQTNIVNHFPIQAHLNQDSLACLKYYENNSNVIDDSQNIGSVSNGKLINGKLVPFYGENYAYFDSKSYLEHRAYTTDEVLSTILSSYKDMELISKDRFFYLMELSNKDGGKIWPHRTHQNGLSADFMMPMLRNSTPYCGLDTLGIDHYWLRFNNSGEYSEDKSVKVDFELIAKHILNLDKNARKNGMKISKVIIKIEYKDELFSGEAGQKLKNSGIYVVRNLSKLINDIHDDHYHVDFMKI